MGIRLASALLIALALVPAAGAQPLPYPPPDDPRREEPPFPTAEELEALREQLEVQQQELEALREEREQLSRELEDAAVLEELRGIREELRDSGAYERRVAVAEQLDAASIDLALFLLQVSSAHLTYGWADVRPLLVEARSVLTGPAGTALDAALFWFDRGDLFLTRISIQTAFWIALEERNVAAGTATPIVE